MKKITLNIMNNKIIPLCEPEIRGNEWKYIKNCLDTNWVSSVGKYVSQFESLLAEYIGRQHAVACINGTAALHIALLVSGIKPDEEVILPALTFVAPANAVRYIGAWPVFMDVQTDIWQIDPEKTKEFLTKNCKKIKGRLVNRSTKRTVRAIIPVHLLGHPVDMDTILQIARHFGLVVIEDVAESLGAVYKGYKTGSFGDIACLSFNGNKIITTGGGGMMMTNNLIWAEKARYLTTQAKDDPLESIHNEVGYNYRLSNLQAAMGVAQLENLNDYIAIKRNIAFRYNKGLRGVMGISLPQEASWAESIFWLYTILINQAKYGMNSRDLLNKLSALNIQTRPLWHPLHTLKPFKKCYAYKVEEVNKLYREGLSLPSSVGLRDEQQNRVIQIIREWGKK